MDAISLHVLTGDGPVLEQTVEAVNLPTAFGSIGVLKGHAPMLCNLEEGVLRCRSSQGTLRLFIGSGIASVEHNEVNVLVSAASLLEE
ncbi:MAG: ATP synthase F1 subunit epsilon [Oscillospiraceae bacterium]|nr:ATP synthase F1 subunit epsilon [Oscillospiraceae bacterium]MBR3475363.1 ATP synthase F1 subunit epsilon [Oscillospiraceae bacterium]